MLSTAQADPTPWLPLPDLDDWVDGEPAAATERANNYYRARYYDPKIGRFLSEDPIRFAGGINFYSYVDNNPANLIDPWGLIGESDMKSFRPRPPAPPNIVADSSRMARDAVGRTSGRGGLRDREDAIRHCIASCWCTLQLGATVCEVLGVMNEAYTDLSGSQTTGDRGMDLGNNSTGRSLACGSSSPEDCRQRCIDTPLIHGVGTGGPYPPR